ncbi:histidine kinase dimerization/phospho-acceptor domain-containing protein [Croceicoccus sp. Ery15]|uniref:histidine kinase dimerization/phospho-acceptor domain-containing protein n=1 Tax=Croceicoccus sp. Ery15 TaxID=1703338 RepID=UPI001E4A4E70|nr:histidine kinase dimerization/phospho-acceptor domain-containing protein [Croceicoccus sp. Ery15]
MTLDDRLRTVLGVAVDGERAALAQFRQLVDLLGSGGSVADGQLVASAFLRLSVLSRRLPVAERVAILHEPGLRLRTASLVAQLCEGDPLVAEAAIDSAVLDTDGWDAVIPMLSNGLRTHAETRRLHARVEVEEPAAADAEPAIEADPTAELATAEAAPVAPTVEEPMPMTAPAPAATPAPADIATAAWRAPRPAASSGTADIASLVQRIEDYREQRASRAAAMGLAGPVRPAETPADIRVAMVDCRIGPDGRIGWAGTLPSLLTGMGLSSAEDAQARIDARSATALRRQQVVRSGQVTIDGAQAITGNWRLDAVPRFDQAGRFLGHHARLTRQPEKRDESDPRGDEVRQALHELRTPLGAIQGFAEIIQQQLFGDVPNRYRAQAADIAAESARLLAGLEEVERLVRMRESAFGTGGKAMTEGETALAALLGQLVDQFASIEQGNGAQFVLDAPGADLQVPVDTDEAETMLWRLLATLSAASAAGERLEVVLSGESLAELAITLPRALRGTALFDADVGISERGEPLLGMLGAGFALRLVAAEVRAAGGSFSHDDEYVMLRLPIARPDAFDHVGASRNASAA